MIKLEIEEAKLMERMWQWEKNEKTHEQRNEGIFKYNRK